MLTGGECSDERNVRDSDEGLVRIPGTQGTVVVVELPKNIPLINIYLKTSNFHK